MFGGLPGANMANPYAANPYAAANPYGNPYPQPGAVAGHGQDIASWFHAVDVDRSGQINVHELHRALAMGGFNVSLALAQQLIRLHDRDFSGQIDFHEFQQLHQFMVNMQAAFKYFDRDMSGTLTIDEVFNALRHAGFTLDRPAFERAMKTFDSDNSMALNATEFLGLCAFLQSCSLTFKAFDPSGTGQIHLSFSQFVYAGANVR